MIDAVCNSPAITREGMLDLLFISALRGLIHNKIREVPCVDATALPIAL